MTTTDTAALVRQMREALRRIDSASDPDDWAGDDRMMDITGPAIAAADQWLAQRGPLTPSDPLLIMRGAESHSCNLISVNGAPSSATAYALGWRAAERAHGISQPAGDDAK